MTYEEHPYTSFIHRVKKPAQYLGGEPGDVKKDWSSVRCRIALGFPDVYEVGMSHLGYKILYGLLAEHPELLGERAFAVWHDMERELRERDEPLRSLETWRPLSDFDIVGFSLQYELTYTNVLTMLDLGGIPLRGADRGEGDPLVVAGGPAATHAEAMAPFIDAFLIGDGEEKVPELMLTWAQLRDDGVPRAERLRAIAALGGFYVPALYETALDEETGFHVVQEPDDEAAPYPVVRSFLRTLDDHPFPSKGPVSATETVFDRVSVEIARGCTEGCRFCQAGMIYRPVRERDPQEVIDTVVAAIDGGGYDEASFTCLSTADYSAVAPLIHKASEELKGRNVSLSVSSLRAYGLSANVLDDLKQHRAGGLTFAPEAGTQRMRDVVNKNVTEEQLLETADRVFSRGWSKMKLYFMIGLPTEEDEDVLGIVQTGRNTQDVGDKLQGRGRTKVTVSVSTHVPKPHTPFQWCAMDAYPEVVRKQDILHSAARRMRVKIKTHKSEGSWLEGVLARGDRRVGEVILRAYEAGARFDSWDEELKLSVWVAAFEAEGIEPHTMLGTLPVTGRLPWDHIDVGLAPGFLAREYRRAVKNRLSPPCGKVAGTFVHHTNLESAEADSRILVCYNCGVACDMTAMRDERLVRLRSVEAEAPRPEPEPDVEQSAHVQDRRPMMEVDQGPRARIRFGFTKVGPIAFSSHLDLVRLVPRLFRRLELPLWYSEGYHPKPVMTFTPALSLGVASVAEYVDLTVRQRDLDPAIFDDLVERLNEAGFAGMRFFAAKLLGPHDPAISRTVDRTEYVAGLPRAVLAELGLDAPGALAAHVEERRAGDLVVRRTVKGIGRNIDVGAYLLEVEVGGGAAVLDEAGIVGDLVSLRFITQQTPKGTCKATEAVDALLGQSGVDCRLVRSRLFRDVDGRDASPLDLSAHRKRRSAEVAAEAEAKAAAKALEATALADAELATTPATDEPLPEVSSEATP